MNLLINNRREGSDINTHIRVISVIDIVLGVFTVLGGLGLFFALGFASFEQSAVAGTLRATGVFAGLFVIALGVLGIVVGIKLAEHQSWARVFQIIFGIFQLVNIPLGTAFGIYSLWAMFSERGKVLFEHPEEVRRAA